MRMARVRAGLMALAAALALGVAVPVAAEAPATVLPANPPTCTAKTLGVSRASNPGLAADCDTLLAIQSTLRVSGWINYDTPLWWDHSHPLNWSARAPLKHWRAVTLGGTPQRVIGLDFSDTRESVKVFDARTWRWAPGQPFTREWTLRGVIPTQLGNLTALETLDLGDNKLTGAVPAGLGNLTALTSLDLSDNSLTGAVPTELGSLTALTSLDLSDNSLSGNLPEALDAITALTWVRVAGNAFTRCAPYGLWAAASHDLATLGLPNCRPTVSYGAPQTTGVVDAQGEYAFFTDAGSAITTYEGLRKDVARLTIHEQDAAGTSWAWFYDDVEAGDAFEWRKANDCWVRYVVDEVLADPSATLKSLSVEWMTYAYTGCTGAVSLTGSRTLSWTPSWVRAEDVTAPVRHGHLFVLYPHDWSGEIGEFSWSPPPLTITPTPDPGIRTQDITAARRLPLWRDPVLPEGFVFVEAHSNTWESPSTGYCAEYVAERTITGIYVANIVRFCAFQGLRSSVRHQPIRTSTPTIPEIREMRIIDGHAAWMRYIPDLASIAVELIDESTGTYYRLKSSGGPSGIGLSGDVDGTIAALRSLYQAGISAPNTGTGILQVSPVDYNLIIFSGIQNDGHYNSDWNTISGGSKLVRSGRDR